MRLRSSCIVVLWVLQAACSLDRSGITDAPGDTGAMPDLGRDAGRDAMSDASRDARPDAPADARPDARDAGPDLGMCPGGGTPEVETCNGLDDDCSGVIDDGACQARIPGGPFVMGCTAAEDALCEDFENPAPAHMITLSPYFLDRTEVTAEAYQRCVSAGTCAPLMPTTPRRPMQPVAEVTYQEARVYCAWRGSDLPTEAQWERAARGTARLTYPWGTAPFSCERAHGSGCSPNDTLDVGSLPMGDTPDTVIHDLGGNVGEWVLDWASITYYLESEGASDPTGPATGTSRVIRGGSHLDPNPANSVRAAHRGATSPETRVPGAGFRCARPAP